MQRDLTQGPIGPTLLRFALPMTAGNLLQQLYNVVDTWVVGYFLGQNALAAVGSAYALMVFLTSIVLGLCMGSGVKFSLCRGQGDEGGLRHSMVLSFGLIGLVTLLLNAALLLGLDGILKLLQVPPEVYGLMRQYLWVIAWGLAATFLYNFFAALLRAVGDSVTPLVFLGVSAGLNIALDLAFVLGFGWGVAGAAAATVLAQYAAGIGICAYTLLRRPEFRPRRRDFHWEKATLRQIMQLSFLTCLQQSVMNFGILLVQGRVNSFGATVMAAFAAAVKIDSFAYMPVQDFGNAFSTFVAQNHGAGKPQRVRRGVRSAVKTVFWFCLVLSGAVCLFARPLMGLFVSKAQPQLLDIGAQYLHIVGACYFFIGLLFLLYGFYRAVGRPGMSLVLTVISLGVRVALAYSLSAVPAIGVVGIWAAVPIGWVLADAVGAGYYFRRYRRGLAAENEP